MQCRASLIPSIVITYVGNRTTLGPNKFHGVGLSILQSNVFDDNLHIVWGSSAPDLSLYEQFKRDSDNLRFVNSNGHKIEYLFNTSESQLRWMDKKFTNYHVHKMYPEFCNSKKHGILMCVMVSLTVYYVLKTNASYIGCFVNDWSTN